MICWQISVKCDFWIVSPTESSIWCVLCLRAFWLSANERSCSHVWFLEHSLSTRERGQKHTQHAFVWNSTATCIAHTFHRRSGSETEAGELLEREITGKCVANNNYKQLYGARKQTKTELKNTPSEVDSVVHSNSATRLEFVNTEGKVAMGWDIFSCLNLKEGYSRSKIGRGTITKHTRTFFDNHSISFHRNNKHIYVCVFACFFFHCHSRKLADCRFSG